MSNEKPTRQLTDAERAWIRAELSSIIDEKIDAHPYIRLGELSIRGEVDKAIKKERATRSALYARILKGEGTPSRP